MTYDYEAVRIYKTQAIDVLILNIRSGEFVQLQFETEDGKITLECRVNPDGEMELFANQENFGTIHAALQAFDEDGHS